MTELVPWPSRLAFLTARFSLRVDPGVLACGFFGDLSPIVATSFLSGAQKRWGAAAADELPPRSLHRTVSGPVPGPRPINRVVVPVRPAVRIVGPNDAAPSAIRSLPLLADGRVGCLRVAILKSVEANRGGRWRSQKPQKGAASAAGFQAPCSSPTRGSTPARGSISPPRTGAWFAYLSAIRATRTRPWVDIGSDSEPNPPDRCCPDPEYHGDRGLS